jgi:hypothetical protein
MVGLTITGNPIATLAGALIVQSKERTRSLKLDAGKVVNRFSYSERS